MTVVWEVDSEAWHHASTRLGHGATRSPNARVGRLLCWCAGISIWRLVSCPVHLAFGKHHTIHGGRYWIHVNRVLNGDGAKGAAAICHGLPAVSGNAQVTAKVAQRLSSRGSAEVGGAYW